MPNCDFYAVGEDLAQVLDFVFSSGAGKKRGKEKGTF
jgi:hypothetical protein